MKKNKKPVTVGPTNLKILKRKQVVEANQSRDETGISEAQKKKGARAFLHKWTKNETEKVQQILLGQDRGEET